MKTNNNTIGQQHIITHILLVITIIFIFTTYVFGHTETHNTGFTITAAGIAPQKKIQTLQPSGLNNSLLINLNSTNK